jgi:ABC-type transport system involved in cytochrome c biogenesis permease subunit
VAAGYLGEARELRPAAIVILCLGHVRADFGWKRLLAMAAGTGRRWLSGTRSQWLGAATGLLLIYLGVIFIIAAPTA